MVEVERRCASRKGGKGIDIYRYEKREEGGLITTLLSPQYSKLSCLHSGTSESDGYRH